MAEESKEGRYALTIVLGAGASKEVDLPIGDELTKQIVDALKDPADPGR